MVSFIVKNLQLLGYPHPIGDDLPKDDLSIRVDPFHPTEKCRMSHFSTTLHIVISQVKGRNIGWLDGWMMWHDVADIW